jgi:predicted house-cleaning noncanonical NTP pyrophosphatase (MazG superfamily)
LCYNRMVKNKINHMEPQHFGVNLAKEDEYPKLVRDNIPELVEKITGKKVSTKILDDDLEYLGFLLKKIEEEAFELANAEGSDHQLEEISDLMELLDVLVDFNGYSWDHIKKFQEEKRIETGRFGKRILMLGKVE